MSRARHPIVCSCLVLGAMLTSSEERRAEGASSEYDCGTLSLYQLLRLEGIDVDLVAVDASLGEPPAGGHSMKRLRDMARRFGLELSGVSMASTDRALGRPMLVFLHRGDHGHFVVVRPLGHTGKLAQVFDGFESPVVVDKSDLFDRSDWTGLALVREDQNWLRGTSVGVSVACLLGVAVVVCACRCWRIRHCDMS